MLSQRFIFPLLAADEPHGTSVGLHGCIDDVLLHLKNLVMEFSAKSATQAGGKLEQIHS